MHKHASSFTVENLKRRVQGVVDGSVLLKACSLILSILTVFREGRA